MEKENSKSLIEIAVSIQEFATEPVTFLELYNKVCEEKGFNDDEKKLHIARFYTDVTASGDFIYCGEDKWDLKKNQKLSAQDSDFSEEHIADASIEDEEEKEAPKRKFTSRKKQRKTIEDIIEEETKEDDLETEDEEYENQPFDDYEPSEDDDGYDDYEKDFDSEMDEDDDDTEDDFDEEKYNSIMDEYEDQYND